MPGRSKLQDFLVRWATVLFFGAWAFYAVYHYVMQFRPIGRVLRERLLK